MRNTHDRGLHLGDITLHHLLLDKSLFLTVLPQVKDNLLTPQLQPDLDCDDKDKECDNSNKKSKKVFPSSNNKLANILKDGITDKGAPDQRVWAYLKYIECEDAKNVLKEVR